MIVTIPSKQEHAGLPMNVVTLEISDNCPECGEPRGKVFTTLSYDGSRRLGVNGWRNKCGHVDRYDKVRDEGKKVGYREPEQNVTE